MENELTEIQQKVLDGVKRCFTGNKDIMAHLELARAGDARDQYDASQLVSRTLQELKKAGLVVCVKLKWYPAERTPCQACKGSGFKSKAAGK